MKNILTLILICISILTKAQSKPDDIYEVTIFEWIQKDSAEETYLIKLDSAGNIYFNRELTKSKVNIKKLNKAVNSFLDNEKVIKEEASDNPPSEARTPENNSKNIFLSIVKQNDFRNDQAFNRPTTYYFMKYNIALNGFEFPFFNYLTEEDKKKIVDLLKR